MDAIKVKNSEELASALGLSPADGAEMLFRSELNNKIIQLVKKKKLTHQQLATLVVSSRTRMTALLNRNTMGISTDLMLRVLGALGYRVDLKVSKVA